MSDMIAAYIGEMSAGFCSKQIVVIMMLFILGYLLIAVSYGDKTDVYEVLLSFPTGLSTYSMAVFLMLVVGIPFGTKSITALLLVIAFVCAVILIKRSGFGGIEKKKAAICLIAMLCIAVISCSGILPVSLSNDSLYYYHMYPKAIVHSGGLRMQYNVFLTDVGQTSAILNTLPFVYGFDEGFGIQTVMVINTLVIMIYALFEKSRKIGDNRKAVVATVILSASLVCSMPYLVMSMWVMSNGYFMCFMFICVYTVWRDANRDKVNDVCGNDKGHIILSLLFVMMSLLRMEGCIIAVILVLCFSTFDYSGKQLFITFLLPVFSASLIYDARIFLFMKIDAPYTFLTPVKALVQFAAIAAVSVYILFIRNRLSEKIRGYFGMFILSCLIFVNAVLFLYDRSLYIENAKAFIHNLSDQSGWGLFPMIVIGVYVMWFIARSKKTGYNDTYWDLCFAAYLLTAIAVSFARDDALRESIADSGNRVMLQVTLLAFFASAMRVISLIGNDGTAENDKNITEQEENSNG